MRPPASPWSTISRITSQVQTSRPWICQQCIRSHQASKTRHSNFSTNQHTYSQAGKRAWRERIRIERLTIPPQHRKVAITAAILFILGSGGLAFSERVRYIYIAAERSGRVGVTLAVNVYEYIKTLKKSEDPNYQTLLSACHKRCAERTLEAMEKNGSIFIKLGQHLSSLNYLLPSEWCDTFIPLQDKCPVSPFDSVDAMVKADTGKSLDEYFESFERRPIGAASLAQVHIAKTRDTGQKVAVKVQHPSLDEWSRLDLALTRLTFRTLKRFFPEYDLTWLSDEMETSLPKELDFREEARNATRMKQYFSHIPSSPLVIPSVLWSQRRILVMEFITGHRPDDLPFLDSHGIDRDEVSAALARIFNEMIFGSGAPLHCDPHGGNLAIRVNDSKRKPRNFDIILYDHGLYRDIPLQLRRNYAHLWLAMLDTDEAGMRKYAYEVGGIGDAEFPIFASAITGRDYNVVTSSNVAARKDKKAEKEAISSALNEGDLLGQLVHLLAKVPRIILLILKTNDLTRSLDENLQTREGPMRSFMILARYAARTVFQEQVEGIRGSFVWPGNFVRYVGAVAAYARVVVRLGVYEYYLSARRRLGLRAEVL
ncbi:hypothetical protein LTR37_002228 [Vermiconidia calcicola]|uniref:Uncharacterized protein n=1 Tax=Vermiconidia calcicola TaxID=1690605 RepID=A0ACC3NTC0_9PEZI|nr:hypothetical protein LTR37_002228 [Vermiconidia calcicola]